MAGKKKKGKIKILKIQYRARKERGRVIVLFFMQKLRNIESTISTAEFSALFILGSYKASNGKPNPMHAMRIAA